MAEITILGIPYDDDSSYLKGAAFAPAAIRNAFRSASSNAFSETEVDLFNHPAIDDQGDLELGSGQNARDQIESAVRNHVLQGKRVLSLGGDHSITYPILKAYASKYARLNVVQFDAHPDLYDELDGHRFSHACPFARAFEDGAIGHLTQVGIRTINLHQRQQIDRFGVEVISAREFAETLIELSGPVYITLDLDVLDPAFAPGVSHHEPGGLSVREVIDVIQNVEVSIVGADIVELNPKRDLNDMTAMVAAKLMKELMAKMLDD